MSDRPCSRPTSISPRSSDAFSEHWAPKIVARYNDNEVRLVKTERRMGLAQA